VNPNPNSNANPNSDVSNYLHNDSRTKKVNLPTGFDAENLEVPSINDVIDSLSDHDIVDSESDMNIEGGIRDQVALLLLKLDTPQARKLLKSQYSDSDTDNEILYDDYSSIMHEGLDKDVRDETDKVEKHMLHLQSQLKAKRSPVLLKSDISRINNEVAFKLSRRDIEHNDQGYQGDKNNEINNLNDNSEQKEDVEKESGVDGDILLSHLKVTRIIMGNLDIFIDQYPYFLDRVRGWIKVCSIHFFTILYPQHLPPF
jgi:hypothetical protein